MRNSPAEAAQTFVSQHYPDCMLAVLGGSASINQHDEASDLDIVVFEKEDPGYFHRVSSFLDWIIECTVLTPENYREYYDLGVQTANPTLQRLVAGGVVLVSRESGLEFIEEAQNDLQYGPMPWSQAELDFARYQISEKIMDLQGQIPRCEKWFVASKLLILLSEFLLRANQQWLGEGKHLFRYLQKYAPETAGDLEKGLETLYLRDDPGELIKACGRALEPYGGTLLVGYEA
ncbi:nucleotidyltransferase domain-containing protein [Paenibacillus macerans]|uniref:nucleotidyltransferase domain-containing protein n=1 Tax=Paenibacillus macerans TaxID=44252 RepID=UPI002DB56FB3|nr:nucleotidyltransferase domain-containing protein [Paenibacillus macerans]MEC0330231.1 nucleotidyltransferase domain-containing protein [Paenibacillus macerans]MED4953871.1 nucleotidyltransferase domain-containing protein [Paenibacillus macerans]